MKEKKIEMDELHTWHEVPAISYYFHVFKESFDLIDFEIEDFEESLLVDGSENISSFIPDLIVRLLRGFYKTKDGLQITLDNYNHYLKDLLDYHYKKKQNIDNPVENKDFKYLGAKIKVEVLLSMCNWRLELEDAMELTKNIDSDHMRVDPIGTDCDGNIYWYFYGTRLYKENNFIKKEPENVKANHSTPTKTKSGRPVRKKAKVDEETKSCKNKQSDLNNSIETVNSINKVWSLHCSTLQDWDDFLKELQSKKNKKEKELLDAIVVLDVTIKKLFKEKEASYNRKMLLMAPRRSSDRITMKMKIKEEEEKIQEEERLLKSLQKAKELDEKHKQEQEERLKQRNRRILEREKLLEERALRVKQREEQKLNVDNPDLLHSTRLTEGGTSSSKKVVYSEESDSEQNEMLYSMERVIFAMLDHNDSWPFEEPVREEEAPKYYTYIEHPMDLNTIAEKIKKVYQQKSEFEKDVLLIFDNCEIYNGTTNLITKMAMKLKKVFLKQMKKEFPPELDDDDDNFFISDERTPKLKRSKSRKSTNSSIQEQKKVVTPVTAINLMNSSSIGSSYKLVQSSLKIAPICQDIKGIPYGQNNSMKISHQDTGAHQTVFLNQNNDSLLMNPLHQLADTALAPLQVNSKIVSTNSLLRSNSLPYNLVPVKHQIGDLTPRISSDSATVRGRPRKALTVTTTVAQKSNPVSSQSPQLDSNNLVAKLHPATITWNDLKRQLMLQMKSAGVNIAADSPRWEQVKEQIMTQMNGLGANVPKVIFTQPQQLIKPNPVINSITTTPSGQMFSFSNVIKSREVITSAITPIDRSTFPILTQIDHVAQPSHSKVESWLNSTREFIGKDSESATSSPQSFHTSLPIMSSLSNPVRLIPDSSGFLRNAAGNHVDTLRPNNNVNSSPASGKSNNDLKKAAQQVVAINQISSKLQEHLGKPVDLNFANIAVSSRVSSPNFQVSNGLEIKKQLKNLATTKSEKNLWNPQDISVVNQLIEKKITKSLPIVFRPLGPLSHQLNTTSSTLVRPEALSTTTFTASTTRQFVVSKSLSVFSSHLNTNSLETSSVMSVSRNICLSQTQEANNSHHIFVNNSQQYTPKCNKTPVLIAPLSTGQLRLNINAANFIKSPSNDKVVLKAVPSTISHSFMSRISSSNLNGKINNSLEKSDGLTHTSNILFTTNSTNVGVFSRSQDTSLISNTSSVNESHHLLNGVSKYDSSTAKSFIKLAPT